MLPAKPVRNKTYTTLKKKNNSSRIRHSFGSRLTPAWHGAKAADVIPARRAPSATCDDASQTGNTLQSQRGEPEASFTLCCDVDDTQVFERTQLSPVQSSHWEKTNTIHPIFPYSTTGSDHAGLPLRGWMEKASWGSITYTWNSKSMGLLHVRGMLRRMLQTGKKIKSIFFQSFNSNAWKEVCLAVWKNPNWQASQYTRHWNHNTHTHTHLCPSGAAGRSRREGMCRSLMTG